MEGIIEKALIGDLGDILELQKRAFAPVAAAVGQVIPPMVQTYEDIVAEYETKVFLKYTLDGRIVGSIRAFSDQRNVCQIERVIVDPGYQNRGIGKALMRGLEKCFPDCDGYELFTGAGNRATVHFYTSLGYRKTCVRDAGGVSLLYMKKDRDAPVRLAEEKDLGGIHELYGLCTAWLAEQGIRQWDTNIYPTYDTAREAWEDGELFCMGEDPVKATMVLNETLPPQYEGVAWKYGGRALVIHTLIVHPRYGGQGLGKQLLAFAERHALERGCTCIRIDVFPKNPAAVGLYQKHG